MWRFHKYFGKELLTNLGLTFLMLFGIALLSVVARGIEHASGANIVWALLIALLLAIDTVPHLLNISLLLATVFTFSRSAAENEITALRMAGISPIRLMGSVLFVGAFVAAINCFLIHNVIPYVHYKKYRVIEPLVQQLLSSRETTNNSWEIGGNSLRWRRSDGNRYEGLIFKKPERDGHRIEGFAAYAERTTDRSKRILTLTLHDVRLFRYERLDDGALSLENQGLEAHLSLSVDLEELLGKNQREEGEKDVSTVQLVSEYARGGSKRPGYTSWLIHDRNSRGLAGLLFAIVGFPIGLLMRRAGRGAAVAFSLLPLGLYYLLHIVVNRALATSLGASWPAYLPLLGLFGLAWLLLHRAYRR
ncbi:MAG: LptF/LptG family permease [Planctomycetota bacterium]